MLIMFISAAVLVTNAVVAALFLSTRPRFTAALRPSTNGAVTAEIDAMVVRLRVQVEQATAEVSRQKSDLRSMFAGVETPESPARAMPPARLRTATNPAPHNVNAAPALTSVSRVRSAVDSMR